MKFKRVLKNIFVGGLLIAMLSPLILDYITMMNQASDVNQFLNKTEDSSKVSLKEAENKVIGILTVPKIKLRIPIYKNTSEYALSNGCGLIEGSDNLSVDHNNKHSSLSSHNGQSINRLFTKLEKLENGDKFFITLGKEILEYQVFDTQTHEPTYADVLNPIKGKDVVSLMTCTPIVIHSHRLYKFGERIETNLNDGYHFGTNFGLLDFLISYWYFLLAWLVFASICFYLLNTKKKPKKVLRKG